MDSGARPHPIAGETFPFQMKNAFVLLFLWAAACIASSQEATNVYPTMIADVATNFYFGIRSNVTAQIQIQLSTQLLGHKDLNGFIANLDLATNDLHQAGFGKKLDCASHQIESARSRIDTLLQDADSKLLAQGLNPEKWLERIASAKSQGNALRLDLGRLRSIVEELADWSTALEDVAPPPELAGILKIRLEHLLDEWEGRRAKAPKPVAAIQTQPGSQPTQHAHAKTAQPESPTRIPLGVANLSPSASEILNLAQAGAQENIILGRITNSPVLYNLSADDILVISGGGVSQSVIVAMLRHDSLLKRRPRAPQ